MSKFDHASFVKALTTRPGVYQMYGKEDNLLYVGKAKNLKNRVSSYFRASGLAAKTMALVARIEKIDCCVVRVPMDRPTSFSTRTVEAREYGLVKARTQ